MKRVLCDATVDRLGPKEFQVTVQGRGDHEGQFRVYTVKKLTEDYAAREGIRRFVADMGGDA
jgi:hypothetical protein